MEHEIERDGNNKPSCADVAAGKVWIVNAFWDLPQEGNRAQRYWLMAEAFVRAGYSVVYWTGDFSHITKQPRVLHGVKIVNHSYEAEGIRVVLLPTKPYKKNISLERILSHRALAKTFRKLAGEEQTRPDLVVASTPPLSLCDEARLMAHKFGAKFICDIQDAWPETFERVVPRFMLSPLRAVARRIYCNSDAIISTGSKYEQLAKSYGATATMQSLRQVIKCGDIVSRRRNLAGVEDVRLVYCGNMSKSYDLVTLVDAVKGMKGVTLDLAGNGPDRKFLEHSSRDCERIRFHGYLGENELAVLLASCDVGVIPMFPDSCVAVPAKMADYAAAGLRVIECLGGECTEIVETLHAGVHYEPGDVSSLKSAVERVRELSPDYESFRNMFDGVRVMDEFVRNATRQN